jgi:dTMP kinase
MTAPIPRDAPDTTRGRFLSLEGIDGAGKSSHVEAIEAHLRAHGLPVTRTREPGGTPLAESLRELFLHRPMDALTEALLVFAARRDHVVACIEPALARGDWVLCDRFTDATFAYQGGGRGFDEAVLGTLEGWVQQGLQPHLTLWFDVDPTEAARRRAAAREGDRLEQEDLAFFARVQHAYARRAAASGGRIVRVDASQPLPHVRDEVLRVVDAHLVSAGVLPATGGPDGRR